MYAKIISLGLVASLLAIDAGHEWLRHPLVNSARMQWLAPLVVGDWQQTSRWFYPEGVGQYQEYAQYKHDELLVTLSYDHNRHTAHNAVNCFLGRGELLESSMVRSLKAQDGSARFNVAHLASGKTVSLAAASQCAAQGCVENPPAPGWADLSRFSFWSGSLFRPYYSSIPVNISIVGGTEGQQQPTYEAMDQALAAFVESLDLIPVRQQAQIESGMAN